MIKFLSFLICCSFLTPVAMAVDKPILFISENIVLEESIINGTIFVNTEGKIERISTKPVDIDEYTDDYDIINVGDNYIMAGIIDSHVHVNEPGRTDWEGYTTATKAAAAGGITTIADMPLNSIPPTTTMENLKVKVETARPEIYVDVAFWGGIVPGNKDELRNMIDAGVVGFKCFLTPSGVDEFQNVSIAVVKEAIPELLNTTAVLAFHAEEECSKTSPASECYIDPNADPTKYATYLNSRPQSMEVKAIKDIIGLVTKYNVRTHIVHLSAADALPEIIDAKSKNLPLTVETCHHYLHLHSEEIPDKHTEYKCSPPLRNNENREQLWAALKDGVFSLLASDHSPSTADVKLLNSSEPDYGNFLKAWGGISSMQFGLNLFWTSLFERGWSIHEINKYMSRGTAELLGLHNVKGRIAENYDADLVIWNPFGHITINEDNIYFKNKITPYLGRTLKGQVIKTIVRGQIVYDSEAGFSGPVGKPLINI